MSNKDKKKQQQTLPFIFYLFITNNSTLAIRSICSCSEIVETVASTSLGCISHNSTLSSTVRTGSLQKQTKAEQEVIVCLTKTVSTNNVTSKKQARSWSSCNFSLFYVTFALSRQGWFLWASANAHLQHSIKLMLNNFAMKSHRAMTGLCGLFLFSV